MSPTEAPTATPIIAALLNFGRAGVGALVNVDGESVAVPLAILLASVLMDELGNLDWQKLR